MNLYGTLVEFKEPEPLIAAARVIYAAGLRRLDAYTPFPVEELPEALGFEKENVAFITLLGALGGGATAFLMQWYANVIDYPINVGGRPFFSWPAFMPVIFELTVLGAALSAAFGMLVLNRLPQLWHPVFEAPEFARASRDRFFLGVLAVDPLYDFEKIKNLLKDFAPLSFQEVNLED